MNNRYITIHTEGYLSMSLGLAEILGISENGLVSISERLGKFYIVVGQGVKPYMNKMRQLRVRNKTMLAELVKDRIEPSYRMQVFATKSKDIFLLQEGHPEKRGKGYQIAMLLQRHNRRMKLSVCFCRLAGLDRDKINHLTFRQKDGKYYFVVDNEGDTVLSVMAGELIIQDPEVWEVLRDAYQPDPIRKIKVEKSGEKYYLSTIIR